MGSWFDDAKHSIEQPLNYCRIGLSQKRAGSDRLFEAFWDTQQPKEDAIPLSHNSFVRPALDALKTNQLLRRLLVSQNLWVVNGPDAFALTQIAAMSTAWLTGTQGRYDPRIQALRPR
jgi:hypothetical protein